MGTISTRASRTEGVAIQEHLRGLWLSEADFTGGAISTGG